MRYVLLTLAAFLTLMLANAGADISASDLDNTSKRQARIVASGLSVASTATVSSEAFFITRCNYHGIWIRVTGSAPDLKFYRLQSQLKDSTGYTLPNSLDSAFAEISTTGEWCGNITWAYIPWGKIRIVGQAGNGADTEVDIVINKDYTGN